MSNRTGISVEQVETLEHAAQMTASSAGALDNALEQFSKRIGDAAEGPASFACTVRPTASR